MAVTQQFARVAPDHLECCRATALDSPDADPGWDPPVDDTLDTDWALGGLLRYCRARVPDPGLTALLERVIDGDPGGDIGFLDHPGFYDGIDGPPRILSPAAVSDICRALDRVDLDDVLSGLPADPAEAAVACGFGGFKGDVRAYPARHFTATRDFFRSAALLGICMLVWRD
ncbi:hypothetical protein AQI88_31660 [Streptomyces cellostaticus]|uniref:DUF1877 domain-containing protein n=1 Tax=Streptomyces cellostaticus TaxID=67285 RepID=A0A101NGC7_9ACTN|nr:DUF1877 domain-containing protein [Streptomyces cellostaticus]KUM92477.1 hypothetical protein AQI88_31660 [Streptomyces cellostaticus]GHI09321.1 hypothetical protein Scel_76420 [Streptomyces cellostaticus]